MRLAEESKADSPEDAARMAMVAAAVEIELHCPLRLTNLARLRLGLNLVYDIGGKRIEKLQVRMKKGRLYEWPFGREPAWVVQSFIRDYRPILMIGENDWLFPAHCGVDGPRSNNALSAAITGMIDAHVGAEVNVHLFRSFAACLLLEHSPGALNDVRLLLGHQSFDTTLKHYAYLRPKIVAVRHASAIREARHELDPLVRDWFPGKWR
jgi:integrase